MPKLYRVTIKEYSTENVVESFAWMSENRADKVDGGVNINLNHEEYYTVIEEMEG
ncbi:hypothetical protein LCGC14_3003420 [marine sediment metagenome]|uniref:Uncharacterized protein n=1 Tax=marine sediment metagenome TaxID=412755 RepID=A0A0F8X0B0_9ZZZZ